MCLPHLPATAEAASRKKVAPAPESKPPCNPPAGQAVWTPAGSNPREAEEADSLQTARAGAALGLCPREGLHPQHQDRGGVLWRPKCAAETRRLTRATPRI